MQPNSSPQAGLGRKVPLQEVAAAYTRLPARITRVYPAKSEDNLDNVLVVDVIGKDGSWARTRLQVLFDHPGATYAIKTGDPCIVWFGGKNRTDAFVFGFPQVSGDGSSPQSLGENRDYHPSGAMERVGSKGDRSIIAKGTFQILVEDFE